MHKPSFAEEEDAVRLVTEALRARQAPDMAPTVLRAVRAAPRPRRPRSAPRRLVDWLLTPRPVPVRPAYGFAFAAAFVMAVTLAPLLRSPVADGTSAAAEPPVVYVQFSLQVDDASTVSLAGSFTDWEARFDLWESSPGVWSVQVPLQPGIHDYAFVVDGSRWVTDPRAPRVDDDFGGSNNRLPLLPPANRS